jgi:hypothetical protein
MNLVNLPKTKAGWIATVGFVVIVTVGVAIMLIAGGREPSVTIGTTDDYAVTLTISGMYGTTVDIADISWVSLVEQSMNEIGTGRRTNGFNSSMYRGHFTSGLLFVRPNASPTLRIDRDSGSTIYISFNDPQKTINLYRDLWPRLIPR